MTGHGTGEGERGVDLQTVTTVITLLAGGGPKAVGGVLVLVVALLLLDRKRVIADLAKKEARVEKIVEKYYKGNVTLTEALNGVKSVLAEIKFKL